MPRCDTGLGTDASKSSHPAGDLPAKSPEDLATTAGTGGTLRLSFRQDHAEGPEARQNSVILIASGGKIWKNTEDASMRRHDPKERRGYCEAVGLDTLLTLFVALPVAALVFIILHI
jgi:hypothetical protein